MKDTVVPARAASGKLVVFRSELVLEIYLDEPFSEDAETPTRLSYYQ